MAKRLTARLHQTDGLSGARLFELFDDRFLRIRRRSNRRQRIIDSAFDIGILAPTAERIDHYPRPWLWAAGAAAILLLTCGLALTLAFSREMAAILLPLMGALLWGGILCVTLFFYTARHLLVFHSALAAVPLVELLYRHPDSASCEAFTRHLGDAISALGQNKPLTPHERRAGELRTLRRLAEEHAIPEAVYENAKRRLLALPL